MVRRFGPFELDPDSLELRRQGAVVRLRPQPARLLAYLASRPGELITRDQLKGHLWPSGTFVAFDLGINSYMKQVRAALGERTGRSRFIETLPRRGYRFVAPVTEGPAGGRETVRTRVAVLPFDPIDVTVDPAQRPLTEGFTEELTTRLACLPAPRLGVVARTSVLRYRDSSRPAGVIGRELDVDYLVEGSIRRGAGRLRITAQLIRVQDESHVWARTYEGELDDPFLWQDRTASAMAQEIARALDRAGG